MPSTAPRASILRVLSFGEELVPYMEGLRLQQRLWEARKANQCEDTLIVLQHAPVFTLGKRGREADFRVPIDEVRARGIEVCTVPRGGEVTYHGPGQLVAYPIFALRQLKPPLGARAFVERLEDTMVGTSGRHGVIAEGRVPGRTGVWVGGASGRKIGAIGVQISEGTSRHGIALNVSTDLTIFDLIIPCGVADRGVTSLAEEAGRAITAREVLPQLVDEFREMFGFAAAEWVRRDAFDGHGFQGFGGMGLPP